MLQLGRAEDVFDVLIKHSQQSQYNSPDSVEISDNLDDRKIWTVRPTLKAMPSSVDTVGLQGSYEIVAFRYDTLRDSKRKGANVFWNHRVSQSDSFGASGGSTQITYPNGTQDDFDLAFANLSFSARLRTLQYSVMIGVNKATFSDGDKDYQAPTYRAVLS